MHISMVADTATRSLQKVSAWAFKNEQHYVAIGDTKNTLYIRAPSLQVEGKLIHDRETGFFDWQSQSVIMTQFSQTPDKNEITATFRTLKQEIKYRANNLTYECELIVNNHKARAYLDQEIKTFFIEPVIKVD